MAKPWVFLVGISSFGLALGPAVGGILVSTVGWRWIFWINPPLAFICWLSCFKALKESKSAQPRAYGLARIWIIVGEHPRIYFSDY